MPSGEPDRKHVGPEESRANARAVYVSQLEAAGGARVQALREADDQLDRIARILADAVNAGLSLTDVARITGVSRPTLYQLRARYGDSHADLRMAILQAVADAGCASLGQLVETLGRPQGDLWPVLRDYVETGAVELEPSDDEEPQPTFSLTEKGDVLLQYRQFQEEAGEDEEFDPR
jgi:hypothetical protein